MISNTWPTIEMGQLDQLARRAAAVRDYADDAKGDFLMQRTLFSLFESTHPAAIGMADQWIKKEPQSALAHVAHGWSLFRRGSAMRGGAYVADTYPAALEQAEKLFEQAGDEAATAYKMDPELIAASDLLIGTAMGTGRADELATLVDKIMQTQPNPGTLQRAAMALSPRWGGSLDDVLALCDRYAARITAPAGYDADVCKADLLQQPAFDDRERAVVADIVARSDHPLLLAARIKQKIANGDKSPAFQTELENYLFDIYVTDVQAAAYLDETFSIPIHRPRIMYDVQMRALMADYEKLQRDPANPVYMAKMSVVGIGDRKILPLMDNRAQFRQQKAALTSAPYDPYLWSGLADLSAYGRGPKGALEAAHAFELSVIYSNYQPDLLRGYAAALADQYEAASRPTLEPDGQEVPPDLASAQTVLCPFVRAERLFEGLCQQRGYGDYCTQVTATPNWVTALADAKTSGLCKVESSAALEDLAYSDEPLDPETLREPD